MSSDLAIAVQGLTKTYRIYERPLDRLRQSLAWGGRRHFREFTALDGVSFEVRRGDTIGVVGRNGSGKSTLLQLICGILKPTSGAVQVSGRISALLELGAGFHPEFTGRENVFMQGALVGFAPEEMERRLPDIEAFAGIGDFIGQPVKTYSSGMFVRLAFAAAVNMEPDILVVDEALAVGDARFQSKCFRRLEMLKNRGTTILMVSHATELITRLCNVALLFDCGRLVAFDDAATVVSRYLDLLFDGTPPGAGQDGAPRDAGDIAELTLDDALERFHLRPAYNPGEYRWGDRSAVILDFDLCAGGKSHATHIGCDEGEISLALKILFLRDVLRPVFGLVVKSKEGYTLCAVNSLEQTDASCPRQSNELVFVNFSLTPHLGAGDYFMSVGVSDGQEGDIVPLDRRYDSIHLKVIGRTAHFGAINMSPTISVTDARRLRDATLE